MAEDAIPPEVERAVNEAVGDTEPKTTKRPPTYRVVGKSKIPVSKSTGALWKLRKGAAEASMKDMRSAWDEAIRYYDNDQSEHRTDGMVGTSGNARNSRRLKDQWSETENIVFANVNVMRSALYSRNPTAEFTSLSKEQDGLTNALEELVNALLNRRSRPGVNLKPKAKRAVVTSLLTNRGWLRLGWTFKEDSSEQAYIDLQALAKELEGAKTSKEIEETEGKISALEDSIDLLQIGGPYACTKLPHDILIDTDANESDLSDARWMMERDYLPTNFLLARYARKKDEEYKMVFKPSHVMKVSRAGEGGEHDNVEFTLFKDAEHSSYGFDDEKVFDRSKVTMVWWVWDRITRRLLLFNDADWSWPIWVWDDPYNLDTFFPYYPLSFHDSPAGLKTKGEVTYYLDQQDSLNEIADETRKARRWARRNVFYNKNLTNQADVEAVLKGDDSTARGLDLPEGMKLSDVIGSIVPPSMQFKDLFDKAGVLQAIDRISSVNEVMRGEQFKTNTNTTAVQANVSASSLRIDDKSDEIEDWLGAFCWGLAQLCLQFMDKEQVAAIIGAENAEAWKTLTAQEISETLSMNVVGGSTKKPTSQAKKEEALELGQVLGQFVKAAPGPVTLVMLKVMEKAFDEILLDDDDWAKITASIEQQSGAEAQDGEAQGGTARTPQTAGGDRQELQQLLAQIPPEVKAGVMREIESGVPPQQAITRGLQQLSKQ